MKENTIFDEDVLETIKTASTSFGIQSKKHSRAVIQQRKIIENIKSETVFGNWFRETLYIDKSKGFQLNTCFFCVNLDKSQMETNPTAVPVQSLSLVAEGVLDDARSLLALDDNSLVQVTCTKLSGIVEKLSIVFVTKN